MNDQLGSASRALLDAAREGLTPDAAAIARVRGKVGVAAAAGAAAGALAGKLGVLAVVAAIAGGGALYMQRDQPLANQQVTFVAPTVERSTPVLQTTREQAPLVVDSDSSDDETEMPAIIARATPTKPRARMIDLGREVALVDTAMAAMRRGDAAGALAAVRMHASETAGAGQLAEDATAIEIEALCRLHDRSVVAKLAAFDARFPTSAQRSRLTTKCP